MFILTRLNRVNNTCLFVIPNNLCSVLDCLLDSLGPWTGPPSGEKRVPRLFVDHSDPPATRWRLHLMPTRGKRADFPSQSKYLFVRCIFNHTKLPAQIGSVACRLGGCWVAVSYAGPALDNHGTLLVVCLSTARDICAIKRSMFCITHQILHYRTNANINVGPSANIDIALGL